jgi:hypothetical protein
MQIENPNKLPADLLRLLTALDEFTKTATQTNDALLGHEKLHGWPEPDSPHNVLLLTTAQQVASLISIVGTLGAILSEHLLGDYVES